MIGSGSKRAGFSLIEVMIVMVIVAILAAVAVPSYQSQILRGKRSEAKAFLLDLASRQERFYTQYATYTDTIVGGSCSGEACGLGLSSSNSSDGNYSAVVACTGSSGACTRYTLTVSPQFADPECSTLTYTSAGVKGATGTGDVEFCWR